MTTDHQNQKIPHAFVCGWPIEHSRSPLIHTHWLKQMGIKGSYERLAVQVESFPEFLASIKNGKYIGGNVTIPHKESALNLVDKIEPAAAKIGAVNTLWMDKDQLVGGNTDWLGFAANLDQNAQGWDKQSKRQNPVLVLGAGGAARGIIYALLQRGFNEVIVANRTKDKAIKIAADFGSKVSAIKLEDLENIEASFSIIVNTTSLGMSGHLALPPVVTDLIVRLRENTIVTDIVYVPLKTELLQLAENRCLKTVDGLGMLLHQAVPGFEKWFGKTPTVTDQLRDLVIADMEISS